MSEKTYLVLKVGNGRRIRDGNVSMTRLRRRSGWDGFKNKALLKTPGTAISGLGLSSG